MSRTHRRRHQPRSHGDGGGTRRARRRDSGTTWSASPSSATEATETSSEASSSASDPGSVAPPAPCLPPPSARSVAWASFAMAWCHALLVLATHYSSVVAGGSGSSADLFFLASMASGAAGLALLVLGSGAALAGGLAPLSTAAHRLLAAPLMVCVLAELSAVAFLGSAVRDGFIEMARGGGGSGAAVEVAAFVALSAALVVVVIKFFPRLFVASLKFWASADEFLVAEANKVTEATSALCVPERSLVVQ